jgi:hypothetical protein
MSSGSSGYSTLIQGYQLEEAVIGARCAKLQQTLPQTATSTLFTVTGGAILVTNIFGVVTTTIGGACNLSIGLAPTIGSAATAGIGGPTALASAAAGTIIGAPATPGVAGMTLVAPGVPASGTATTNLVTNNYHGTVAVALSGFTLTFVYINGVQVGTTNATYQLPAHGTMSITYSVGGTWTWTASGALEIGNSGATSIGKEHVISPGLVTLTTSASVTGAISWYLNYIPLDVIVGNTVAQVGSVGVSQVN